MNSYLCFLLLVRHLQFQRIRTYHLPQYRKELMLFPASWMPVVIKEAVPETITGIKAIAIRITNMRQIHGFMFPSSVLDN